MKKKILIVDDEPSVVRLLSKHLKAKGYETFTVNDGYRCIKMVREVKPDFLFMVLSFISHRLASQKCGYLRDTDFA